MAKPLPNMTRIAFVCCGMNCLASAANLALFWLEAGGVFKWVNLLVALNCAYFAVRALSAANRNRRFFKLDRECDFHIARIKQAVGLNDESKFLFHQEQLEAALERMEHLVNKR